MIPSVGTDPWLRRAASMEEKRCCDVSGTNGGISRVKTWTSGGFVEKTKEIRKENLGTKFHFVVTFSLSAKSQRDKYVILRYVKKKKKKKVEE